MGLFDLFKKKPAPAGQSPVEPVLRPGAGLRPVPEPKAKNNFIIVILDSCRFDSFVAAAPKTITKLGAGREALQLRRRGPRRRTTTC